MNLDCLRPYQIQNAAKLAAVLTGGRSAADLSDTGTGKTWTAAAVLAMMRRRALVVAPKISISHWQGVLGRFGLDIPVVTYELLKTGRTPWGSWTGSRWFAWNPDIQVIVWDEAHRCKGRSSQNSTMLTCAHRQGRLNLLLSATLCQEPLDLKSIGETLGLFRTGGWSKWIQRQGYTLGRWGGWAWNVPAARREAILDAIRAQLAPVTVRTRWSDIPGFADRVVVSRLVDLEPKQRDTVQEIVAYVRLTETPLTAILRYRQCVEKFKVPVFASMAKDLAQQGFSVAVFLEFLENLQELSKRCGCPVISGDTRDRQRIIQEFQDNRTPILGLQAYTGGLSISLGDETGRRPRIGLVTPIWSARALLQIFGRLHRVNSRSTSLYYLLYAGGTVEETVCTRLETKLDALSRVNDGQPSGIVSDTDLVPEEFHEFLGIGNHMPKS